MATRFMNPTVVPIHLPSDSRPDQSLSTERRDQDESSVGGHDQLQSAQGVNPFEFIPAAVLRHHILVHLTGQELVRFGACNRGCLKQVINHTKVFRYVLPPGSYTHRNTRWTQAQPIISQFLHRLINVEEVYIDTFPFAFDLIEPQKLSSSVRSLDVVTDDINHLKHIPQLQSLGVHLTWTDPRIKQLTGLSQLQSLDLSRCIEISDNHMKLLIDGVQSLESLSVAWCSEITDTCLLHISSLPGLKALNVAGCSKISDAGAQHIRKLRHLTSLNLSRCARLTDEGVAAISDLPKLRTLDCYDLFHMTDQGVIQIANLSTLLSLNIGWCYGVTDVGVSHLAKLTRLRKLYMSSCRNVSDNAFPVLSEELTDLRELDISGLELITDNALKALGSVLSLRSLDISKCTKVTDCGVSALSSLPILRSLNLCGCELITDSCLRELLRLTKLDTLHLASCKQISDSGLRELSQLPQLRALHLSFFPNRNVHDLFAGRVFLSQLQP